MSHQTPKDPWAVLKPKHVCMNCDLTDIEFGEREGWNKAVAAIHAALAAERAAATIREQELRQQLGHAERLVEMERDQREQDRIAKDTEIARLTSELHQQTRVVADLVAAREEGLREGFQARSNARKDDGVWRFDGEWRDWNQEALAAYLVSRSQAEDKP